MNSFKLLMMVSCLTFGTACLQADDTRPTTQPQQPTPLQGSPKTAAEHSTLMHPDQLQTLVEIEGVVVSTDADHHLLMAKDVAGNMLTLKIISNTRILDTQNRPLALGDLKAKDKVRLYYDRRDNTLNQVDRLPTVTEAILGK